MDKALEGDILALLAKEWEMTGPPGIMDIRDVGALVAGAPSDIMAAIRDLFTRGLVDMNSLKTAVFLTPEGYEAVEKMDRGRFG